MKFHEQFPTLVKGFPQGYKHDELMDGVNAYETIQDFLMVYCLDKKRVREAINNLQVRLQEGNYMDEEGDVIEDCKFRVVRSILYEELGL